jgi:hypothetical protein
MPAPVVQVIYSDRVSLNNKHCPGIGLKGISKINNQHRFSNRVLSHTFQNLHGLSQILYLLGIVYVLYFPTSFAVNICSIVNISFLL